jgi:hypothetical protein
MKGPPPSPRSAVDRFEAILDDLCKAVADQQGRGLPGPLAGLIWTYLKRLVRRFKSLAARARAGKLAAPRPPRPRRAPPDAAAARADGPGEPEAAETPGPQTKPPRRKRLPSRKAWLCVLVPYRAAGHGYQLAQLLNDPEMIALMALSPGFARMLRPLCWAVAPDMTAERVPPRPPRKKRPPKPRKPREKKVYWRMARMPPERGLIFYTK